MSTERAVADYSAPRSSWPPWGHEYRYGALYLFPPESVKAVVNALRARHDPASHAVCEAHVSLTVPFPRPVTEAVACELAAIVAQEQPFEVTWGPLHRFPNANPVVLRIEPLSTVARLASVLEEHSVFQGAHPPRWPFFAHMTIAEFIDRPRSDELVRELEAESLTGSWRCEDVVYAVPDAAFRFTERARWMLRSNAPPRS